MTRTIDRDVTTLRAAVTGAVLLPGNEGYDEARSVWNGDIDRRPAVIVRCTGPDDVAAALRYAAGRQGSRSPCVGAGTATGELRCPRAG